jgi:ABC-type transport system involved in multi-copper enzyme maturation permease subunit
MFKRLLWKEWRENQWKLVFGTAVSLAFTALLFRIRLFPDAANAFVISLVQMLVLPIVYALDIFSGEISGRTIHLLFKFPVQRWKIFFSKYIVCMLEISLIFAATGGLMEAMGQGREADAGFLFRHSMLLGFASLMVFSWFCVFAAQSRSEAGSLVAVFGVMIGWGIVFFWAEMCQGYWAAHFVPYTFIVWVESSNHTGHCLSQLIASQIAAFLLTVCLACWRFVKVRRYL